MTPPSPGDPPAEVRALLHSRIVATLATALPGRHAVGAAEAPPWPFASVVTYALDHELAPILLLSGLADHSKALAADPRASLLVEAVSGLENPQSGPRCTLLCRAAPDDRPQLRARFLARHPAAEMYAALSDFTIWRLAPERVHYIGGFARARWLEWRDVAVPASPALLEAEPGILAHMNADHADAIELYATRLLDRSAGGWQMTGIDAQGCDLRRGGEVARLDFPQPIRDAGEARKMLVQLVAQAREAV